MAYRDRRQARKRAHIAAPERGCVVLLLTLAWTWACGVSKGATTSPSPTATPTTTFSLTGRVTGGGIFVGQVSSSPISGPTVAIIDGPNAGASTTTDVSGNYTFSALQQSGFPVSASANGYIWQGKGVTLTSNQALNFALTRPPGPIVLNGRVTDSATSPTLSVLVLEPGTFRISGAVVSAGLPESATIEIVSGTGSGLRTATSNNFAGQYALYGAAGSVELRVSAKGFNQQVRRLVVTDNTTSDFELNPLVPPTDISGSWVATVSASSSCRANTPEAGWEREFNVNIVQQGTQVSITRTSPTFYESCSVGNRAVTENGRTFGQTLSFVIVGDTYGSDYSFPCLFDRLSPTEWLGISGAVEGTVSGNTIRGTMDSTQGAFDVYESLSTSTTPNGNSLKAICHAADHALALRRR